MSSPSPEVSPRPLGPVGRTALGTYFVIVSLLLVYLLFEVWPTEPPDASGRVPDSAITLFGGLMAFTPPLEVRLILLVGVVGALGSYVHAATSFADFVGNRRIYASWAWWYILRLYIGVTLSLIFYFVIRGGLLSAGATASDVSPFGISAVAGLVGLFSKQATDKLRELFDNLFKTATPDSRVDKIDG